MLDIYTTTVQLICMLSPGHTHWLWVLQVRHHDCRYWQPETTQYVSLLSTDNLHSPLK